MGLGTLQSTNCPLPQDSYAISLLGLTVFSQRERKDVLCCFSSLCCCGFPVRDTVLHFCVIAALKLIVLGFPMSVMFPFMLYNTVPDLKKICSLSLLYSSFCPHRLRTGNRSSNWATPLTKSQLHRVNANLKYNLLMTKQEWEKISSGNNGAI